MSVVDFVRDMTIQVITVAWFVFLVTWVIGWAIKGSPIPFHRVKRAGQSLVEDAVLAAFWLAIGTTVFALISYIVSNIGTEMPPPPQPWG